MLPLSCPNDIRKVADRFKDVTGVSYPQLCQLMAIMTMKTKSISEAVRHAGWMNSVSTLTHAAESFDRDGFMKRIRTSVLNKYKGKMETSRFCFAVDDMVVPRSGKKMFRVGFHPKHGKSGVVRAQRVIVLVDRERGVAFPLAFAMCLNKQC